MLVDAERVVARFEQQPYERKRYRGDYRQFLAEGETITMPTFVVSPVTDPPLVVGDALILPSEQETVFFVENGLVDTVYRVSMRTITNDTQRLEDEFEITIREF
jgi:hypothetical protein